MQLKCRQALVGVLRTSVVTILVLLLSLTFLQCGTTGATGPNIQAKALNSFSPDSGHIGDTVSLHWTPHEYALQEKTSVYFNGKITTQFVFNDKGDISAVVPEGATTGRIKIRERIDDSLWIEYFSQGDFNVLPSN